MSFTQITRTMINISNFSDIDECSEEVDPCGDNSDCTNNIGNYSCRCHVGFEGNPFGECRG